MKVYATRRRGTRSRLAESDYQLTAADVGIWARFRHCFYTGAVELHRADRALMMRAQNNPSFYALDCNHRLIDVRGAVQWLPLYDVVIDGGGGP